MPSSRSRSRVGRVVVAVAAVVAGPACVPVPGPQGAGPWTWTETRVEGPQRTQGLATDPTLAAPGDTWYTSQFTLERADSLGGTLGLVGSLPLDVLVQWKNSHTGDPDAFGGQVVVPWENKQLGPSDPPTKSFGVYDGRSLALVGWAKHVLEPGESEDNPWVTISPDGRWVVSGPYDSLDRLQVFPVPRPPFGDLPLSAEIPLDVAGHSVQGCDFASATELVCASDDESSAKQLFTLDLDAPVGDGASRAVLTDRGPLPTSSAWAGDGAGCPAAGEVEGVDAQVVPGRGTVVRVLVIDRCSVIVHEYEHVLGV